MMHAAGSPRRATMGKLTLVTGIPGTRIQKALVAFALFASKNFGRTVAVHALEPDFQQRARDHVVKFHPQVGASPTVIHTFLLPGPLIRHLWRDAFEAVVKAAQESRKMGDVIVTLHLSFFLHSTREYFVPGDLPLLIEWIRESVDEVVTFVDDIYDVHQSLLGGSTGIGMLDPPETLDATIHDVIQILDWRSVEVMLASSISASADTRHHQFAVKHPTETLHDLLYSPKPIVYLSHPISEPRRLFMEGRVDEARNLVSHMREVVSRLTGSATVIEPTSIDELRFVSGSARLSERWPFKQDDRELVYVAPDVPPSGTGAFAFPVGWDSDKRSELESSDSIGLLQSAISRHINARDHGLVESADQIACYRPLFHGNASRGVEQELRHFDALVRSGLHKDATPVVFLPEEDRKAFARRTLIESLVPGWRRKGLLDGSADGFARFTRSIEASNAVADQVASGSLDALRALLRECELSANPTHALGGGVLGPSQAAGRQAAEVGLASQIAQASVLYLDELSHREAIAIAESERQFYNAFESGRVPDA